MDFRNQLPPSVVTPEPTLSTPPPLTPRTTPFSAAPVSFPVAPVVAPSVSPTPKKTRSLKWLWWSLGGLVFVGILGGGYFAYSRGYISIPYLTPKPDQLFNKMVDSISTINSAQYTVRAQLEAQPRGNGKPMFDTNTLNTNSSDSSLLSTFDPKTLLNEIPGDMKIEGGMTLYIETDKLVQDANGMFKLDGTYAGGDSTVAVDVELRKVGQNLYGIIRKFPSLFTYDFPAVKNKWVVATPTDSVSDISTSTFENQDLRKSVDSLKLATKTALDQKLFTVKQKLAAETISGVRSEHYVLTVNPDKLLAVYTALRDTEKAKGQDVTALESGIAELKKPETMKLLQAVADNSKIEIWIDRANGMLRQIRWGLTIVPDNSIERLKGKQLYTSLTLTLDKVNTKVNISKPLSTIDFDEATRLVTGITKEQQRFNKQTDQISKLRSALTLYKSKNNSYPKSLDELNTSLKSIYTKCLKDNPVNGNTNSTKSTTTIVNTSVGGATTMSIDVVPPTSGPTSFSIESVGSEIGLGGYNSSLYKCTDEQQYRNGVVITDTYTSKPYVYSLDGGDYKLVYQLTLADAKDSYDKESYADGKNTATSKDVSIEKTTTYEAQMTNLNTNAKIISNNPVVNTNVSVTNTSSTNYWTQMYPCLLATPSATKDSDGDGLNDYDEVYVYFTNPCKADTDGDGYSDKTEIDSGYNPNGAGKSTVTTSPAQTSTTFSSTNTNAPTNTSVTNVTGSAPTILAHSVSQSIGQAVVTWSTDIAADGIVNYGLTTAYGAYSNNTEFTTNHSITFGVTSGQTYHYAIRTCIQNISVANSCTSSPDYTLVAQ